MKHILLYDELTARNAEREAVQAQLDAAQATYIAQLEKKFHNSIIP